MSSLTAMFGVMNDILSEDAVSAMKSKILCGDADAPETTASVYGSRPIKRKRRSKNEIDAMKRDILRIVAADAPMTCRQVYYRLVAASLIDKTESAYKRTISYLKDLRLSGRLPFSSIADNTRWVRQPTQFDSAEEALEDCANLYRKNLWRDQNRYIEIWLEKDALAGVVFDVTARFGVPLMVTRGYSSISYLHAAAQTITRIGKPTTIYQLGDHDPSGVNIAQTTERDLRRFAPDAEIDFNRLAVTPEQINEYCLITRPTKRTDSRSKGFEGESVEVDAIPPNQLRSMVESVITGHIDQTAWRQLQNIEDAERESLREVMDYL